jgi:hypothetical protein
MSARRAGGRPGLMEAEAQTPQPEPKQAASVMAGQPITFGGVAAFAQVSWRRLFIIQAVVAGGAVAAVLVLLFSAWLPAIESAIHNLPENGYILRGELAWPKPEATLLTESRWLSLIVTPVDSHSFSKSADLRLELHSQEARFYSMFGYMQIPYGPEFSLVLNRPDAVPWWGARRPFFIAGAMVGTFVGLWLIWMSLALLYAPVAKFMAFWADRDLTWRQAIRVCAAALLLPAIVYSVAIALYGLGWLPLEGLIAICGLHIVMGWVYVAGAPMRLPARPGLETPLKSNPFNHPAAEKPGDKPAGNPFHGS